MKTLAVAITSLMLLAACGTASSATPLPSAIPGAPEIVVSLNEMSIAPTQIRLRSDGVNLVVRNDGHARHDLSVPGLDLRIVVEPGQSATAGLRKLPTGRYEAFCSVFGHRDAGMNATVVVE